MTTVRAALLALVQLKDLKHWIEVGLPGADEATNANAKARYEREKEPAWEAARKALEADPVGESASPSLPAVPNAEMLDAIITAFEESTCFDDVPFDTKQDAARDAYERLRKAAAK